MRRTIAVVLSFLVSCSLSTLAAQSVGSNVMQPSVPSPTAASLGKFGEIPISYFTGVPQISIPLFTVKGKTLELPIALSYNASGIKVEDVGGWVGAGWALEAGGVITRTVRGIVDEQAEGYFNTGYTFYIAGNWVTNPPATLVQNMHEMQTVDGEPDQFYFNFAGMSGEFVGGDTSATHTSNPSSNIFVAIPYRKWRIVPATSFGTNMSWVITTENGTKYTFGAAEMHIDRSKEWLGSGGRDSKWYVSAWYLTEIRSPGGDVITLTYADYDAEHHTGMYREQVNDVYEANLGDCSLAGRMEGIDRIFDLSTLSYMHAKRLSSIIAAGHTITFATSLRDDARSPYYGWFIGGRVQQEPKLDSMIVKTPGGARVRRFEFEYTYTGSLGGRLTLLNVYEEDTNGVRLPPYSFTYGGPTLPAPVTDANDYHDPGRTASFALDHWGYYNGASGNTTLVPPGTATWSGHSYPGADRNPHMPYTQAGVLTRITYPTGGFNDFIYEANQYANGATLISDPSPYSASAGITGTGQTTRDFTVGGVDATSNGHLTIFTSEACGPTPCPFVQLFDNGALISTWTRDGSEPASIDIPWVFTRDHNYHLVASTAGQNITAIAITAFWTERTVLPAKAGAGLRIAEVHADDGMGNVIVRKYSYVQSDGKSSGWLSAEPRYDTNRNMVSGDNRQCIYYSRSSAPQTPLGAGPIVGYAVVTESLGVNGVFGNTRRTFQAGCDCASAALANNYNREWPWLRYTTAGWTRGQQMSSGDYNASGQLQRATASSYGFPPSGYPLISFRGLALDVYSINGSRSLISTWFLWANPFSVNTGLKVETDQTTTAYDTTGTTSVSAVKVFAYGNPNHAQLTEIRETNSDGTQRITRMKYPGDYAAGGPGDEAYALTKMRDVSLTGAHMPGVVIERIVSVKNGASERAVQAEITTFKEFVSGSGQFLPFKHYVLNSPNPIP